MQITWLLHLIQPCQQELLQPYYIQNHCYPLVQMHGPFQNFFGLSNVLLILQSGLVFHAFGDEPEMSTAGS